MKLSNQPSIIGSAYTILTFSTFTTFKLLQKIQGKFFLLLEDKIQKVFFFLKIKFKKSFSNKFSSKIIFFLDMKNLFNTCYIIHKNSKLEKSYASNSQGKYILYYLPLTSKSAACSDEA